MARDYRSEYDNYHSSPKQKKNRAARNAARAAMVKKKRVKKGDGKTVEHKKPLSKGGTNARKNLGVKSNSANSRDGGRMGNRAGKAAGGRKSRRT